MNTEAQNNYPSLNPYQTSSNTGANGTSNGTSLKDSASNSKINRAPRADTPPVDISSPSTAMSSPAADAQAVIDGISNNATVQSISQGKLAGPVAQTAKEEANKTSAQFSNVANSRVTPQQTTANGQTLTHYHSLFFNILSWENPRVTGIAYATIVTFIFFTRYVPILKFFFKSAYTILGIIAAAEIAGKLVFDRGIASQIRPRKYYTIPRQSLENALEDVEQLINFFVIEFQRIVFAENVYVTAAAFASALISYFLVKFVPTWGIALISTTAIFFLPLVYIQNRELIDDQLNNAGEIINQQATQVRDLAAQHTGRAGEVAKSTVSQYSAKAQDLIGQAKSKAGYANTESSATSTTRDPIRSDPLTGNNVGSAPVKREDFPIAPTAMPPSTTAAPAERAPQPVHAL